MKEEHTIIEYLNDNQAALVMSDNSEVLLVLPKELRENPDVKCHAIYSIITALAVMVSTWDPRLINLVKECLSEVCQNDLPAEMVN